MKYVNLGKTGAKVSQICLGCMSFGNVSDWHLETEQSKPIINKAIDLGINFFDTANVYSKGRSEEIVGEILQGQRNDIILASKVRGVMGDGVNDYGLSRYHIMKQIEGSLSRLKTDYIDLYQTHRWDYTAPIEETLITMSDLVRNGQVRYIGASNYFAWQLSKSLWTSKKLNLEKFVSMQNHHNLCYREEEREMIPLCKNEGIGLIPYSPLARGFLAGKYSRDLSPQSVRYGTDHLLPQRFFRSEDFDVLENVIELSNQKNVSPSQIALSWLFKKGITSIILGATKVEHIDSAVGALSVKLSDDDLRFLEDPYTPRDLSGPSYSTFTDTDLKRINDLKKDPLSNPPA